MEKKTNTQSAEIAQTTSNNDATNITLSKSEIWGLRHYGKQLKEIMTINGGLEYLQQLQALDFDYKELLLAIDTGGFRERKADEDPAEVLRMLRGYTLTPQQSANRAFLLQNIANLLCAVEGLLFHLNNAICDTTSAYEQRGNKGGTKEDIIINRSVKPRRNRGGTAGKTKKDGIKKRVARLSNYMTKLPPHACAFEIMEECSDTYPVRAQTSVKLYIALASLILT